MQDFLRRLGSFPPDISILHPPDIAPDLIDAYIASLLTLLRDSDTPAARHTVLQAAALVPPTANLEEAALTWLRDPDQEADGRSSVVQYCATALKTSQFTLTPFVKILNILPASNKRPRDVMLALGRQDFEAFSSGCTAIFDDPTLRVNVVQLMIDVLLDIPFEPTDPASTTNMAKLAALPFIDQLLRSLVLDTDNHLFSLGLRLLLVISPYAPVALSTKVPLMIIVLGRAISWRDRPFVDQGLTKRQGITITPPPRPDLDWKVATCAMSPSLRPPPHLMPQRIAQLYLISLYGAWPSNIIAFTRDPASYIRGKNIPPLYAVEWDEVWEPGVLAARVEPLIRDFRLHPSLVVFTSAAELADNKRWDKIDPSEYIARSQALANSEYGGPNKVDFVKDGDESESVDGTPSDTQLERENDLLRIEARFTSRVRKQYLHHIGRLHRSSLRLNNDEAEIHSFVNRLKEQSKEIAALTSELSQQRTDASQAQQRHLKWQAQLRERVASFREEKAAWQSEAARIRGELGEARSTVLSQKEELAMVKNERFKLQSRLTEAEPKIRHITDYETTIKQLTETQRLWEEDVKRCKEAQAEMESWRGKCFELGQQLRALHGEVASQAQIISGLERKTTPSLPQPVSDEGSRPSPTRDMTFYATLLDEANDRVNKVEREKLELQMELDAMRSRLARARPVMDEANPVM